MRVHARLSSTRSQLSVRTSLVETYEVVHDSHLLSFSSVFYIIQLNVFAADEHKENWNDDLRA